MKIRDERLYRKDYSTFEDYCRERWQFQKAYAHRLIASAKVIENVSPMGDKPTTERQARPLAKLPPEKQAEVWDKAVKTAPEPRVTSLGFFTVSGCFPESVPTV